MGDRLPGLDGVRAIAVLLVVWGHMARFPGSSGIESIGVARLGVTVFFVLSGFLITTLLVDERTRLGRVSLRDFYLRRAIRIFPAAYLYIAVAAMVAWFGWIHLQPGDVMHAVTYTTNYHHERAWSLGHLWSLAVEEQFYLLWPLAFLLAGARSIHVALCVVVLLPLIRVATWFFLPGERVGVDEEFQYVADSLATGCLLALLVERFGAVRIIGCIPRWVFVVSPVMAVAASTLADRPSIYLPVGMTVVNVSIALSILWIVNRPKTMLGRLLESRPAVSVGTISYSLYLWQQLFLDPRLISLPNAALLAVGLSFAAAITSYFLVEKPLLGLRHYFRH